MRGRTITEADVVAFATLTADHHPQHTDARWAAGSAFGERIAHGMLILSYAVGLVDFDPERVVALRRLEEVVFKRPVKIGDTIRIEPALLHADGARSIEAYEWRILNQDDKLVARAVVEVLVSDGAAEEEATGDGRKREAGEIDPEGDEALVGAPPLL